MIPLQINNENPNYFFTPRPSQQVSPQYIVQPSESAYKAANLEIFPIIILVVAGLYLLAHLFFLPAEIITLIFCFSPSFNALAIYFIFVMLIKYAAIVFCPLVIFGVIKLNQSPWWLVCIIVFALSAAISVANIVWVLIGILGAGGKVTDWLVHPYTLDFFCNLIVTVLNLVNVILNKPASRTEMVYYYYQPVKKEEVEMEKVNIPEITEDKEEVQNQ